MAKKNEAEENGNAATEVGNAATEVGKTKMAPNPFPVEEIYVDGIAGVSARGGVFKLDCYRVAGVDREDGAEVRRVTHRLVLPAVAMPGLIRASQSVAKATERTQQTDESETPQ